LKEAYIEHITKTDDLTMNYLDSVQGQKFDKYHQIFKQVQDISDVTETWEDAKMELNNSIKEKMLNEGIGKDAMKKYKFKEFNIHDMYKAKDGTLCRNCAKGLQCSKHPYQKKKDALRGEDFP
jgi:hypothetical protein